jgi:hypothetical protein
MVFGGHPTGLLLILLHTILRQIEFCFCRTHQPFLQAKRLVGGGRPCVSIHWSKNSLRMAKRGNAFNRLYFLVRVLRFNSKSMKGCGLGSQSSDERLLGLH